MDSLAVALDVFVHGGWPNVDDPFLSPRTVFGLFDKFLILEVNGDVAGPDVVLMRVKLFAELYLPVLDVSDSMVAGCESLLCELFV